MVNLQSCNIKGFNESPESVIRFAEDLEVLFKKYHIESINPWMNNVSISFDKHHVFNIKGFNITGNEVIIGESMQSVISQCKEICNKHEVNDIKIGDIITICRKGETDIKSEVIYKDRDGNLTLKGLA